MSDRLDGGQINRPGRPFQAVGAAEHVVPIRGGAAERPADCRDVLAMLDVEGGEQELADVLGQDAVALSAGSVRRGP